MKIFSNIGIEVELIVAGLLAVCLLLFILVIVLFVKNSKLNKRYQAFMNGEDGSSLEKVILERFQEVDQIKDVLVKYNDHFQAIDDKLLTSYQKVGIVKYDAFKEMGGKLSFALCLLNEQNSGFILNSMHSTREGCYTYVKEVIKGEAFVVLAEEEQQALEEATKSNDLIR